MGDLLPLESDHRKKRRLRRKGSRTPPARSSKHKKKLLLGMTLQRKEGFSTSFFKGKLHTETSPGEGLRASKKRVSGEFSMIEFSYNKTTTPTGKIESVIWIAIWE